MAQRLKAWEKKTGVKSLLECVGGNIKPTPIPLDVVESYLNSMDNLADGVAEKVCKFLLYIFHEDVGINFPISL